MAFDALKLFLYLVLYHWYIVVQVDFFLIHFPEAYIYVLVSFFICFIYKLVLFNLHFYIFNIEKLFETFIIKLINFPISHTEHERTI